MSRDAKHDTHRRAVLRTYWLRTYILPVNVAKAESCAQKRIFPLSHPSGRRANEYIRLAHLQYRIV